MKIKGKRTWYTVTLKQIWTQGAWNAAAALKAQRKALREARRKAKENR